MKEYLWERLGEILNGQDHTGAYAGMAAGDRLAVLNILRETVPEFRALHRVRQRGEVELLHFKRRRERGAGALGFGAADTFGLADHINIPGRE